MSNFRFLCGQIWAGRSVARAYFNAGMRQITVHGTIADVGAGASPAYQAYMKRTSNAEFVNLDRLIGDTTNFETDVLPFPDQAFDTVLSMNVLEHIYNYKFHFSELVRIVKPGGSLILFAPFLYMYHPDHKNGLLDCHRYTSDTLERLAAEYGLSEIRTYPVSRGACMAALNMLLLSIPSRFLRLPLFVCAYILDGVLLRFRPLHRVQFPLGYMLEAKKL
jgi:SAM-dependent methyltransferase